MSPAPNDDPDEQLLDRVFFALSDPIRRPILARLEQEERLASELAAPFAISLQAVSRHIQVLEDAGFVLKERTGRISRCRLDAGPIVEAALWLIGTAGTGMSGSTCSPAAVEEIAERGARKRVAARALRAPVRRASHRR